MQLDEMTKVLAIDSNSNSRFRPETQLLDPRVTLTICSTLVSVTAAAETETLVHLSAKRYFLSDKLKTASKHRHHISPSFTNVF